jgi:hypothetical protein
MFVCKSWYCNFFLKEKKMRNVAFVLTAMALMAIPAMGAWTEDFENYAHSAEVDVPLSGPVHWDPDGTTGGAVFVSSGEGGAGDGAASMGAGNWTWGSAFRLSDGGVLQAKVMVESNNIYNAIIIGFSPSVATGGGRVSGPMAEFRLQNGSNAQWNYRTIGTLGSEEEQGFDNSPVADQWYDVRMTDNGGSVDFDFKLLGAGAWTNLGSWPTFAGFDSTYVTISGLRQGYVDDINSTPEPATMAMLGLGGLALIRRRRTRQ